MRSVGYSLEHWKDHVVLVFLFLFRITFAGSAPQLVDLGASITVLRCVQTLQLNIFIFIQERCESLFVPGMGLGGVELEIAFEGGPQTSLLTWPLIWRT